MKPRRVSLVFLVVLCLAAGLPAPAAAQQPLSLDLKSAGVSLFPPAAGAPSVAQGGREGIGVGILIGPLFDNYTSDTDVTDFKNRTGLQFSLFLGGNRPGRVGVATELTLLRRRTEADGDDTTFTTLQVPLFVRVNVGSPNINRAIFYVKFGPAIDVILKAESGGLDIKDDVESFQVDIIGAAGVELNRFIIEGRYIHGIRTINKEFTDVEKITAKAVAILFGVRFN
jgi:hypothetical protein